MTTLQRLIAPDAFVQALLPIVAINLLVQVGHLVGLLPYDGEMAAYIVSAAYLVAIALEAKNMIFANGS